jgi:hypothetical protein
MVGYLLHRLRVDYGPFPAVEIRFKPVLRQGVVLQPSTISRGEGGMETPGGWLPSYSLLFTTAN